jgi:hypothetical protein
LEETSASETRAELRKLQSTVGASLYTIDLHYRDRKLGWMQVILHILLAGIILFVVFTPGATPLAYSPGYLLFKSILTVGGTVMASRSLLRLTEPISLRSLVRLIFISFVGFGTAAIWAVPAFDAWLVPLLSPGENPLLFPLGALTVTWGKTPRLQRNRSPSSTTHYGFRKVGWRVCLS